MSRKRILLADLINSDIARVDSRLCLVLAFDIENKLKEQVPIFNQLHQLKKLAELTASQTELIDGLYARLQRRLHPEAVKSKTGTLETLVAEKPKPNKASGVTNPDEDDVHSLEGKFLVAPEGGGCMNFVSADTVDIRQDNSTIYGSGVPTSSFSGHYSITHNSMGTPCVHVEALYDGHNASCVYYPKHENGKLVLWGGESPMPMSVECNL